MGGLCEGRVVSPDLRGAPDFSWGGGRGEGGTAGLVGRLKRTDGRFWGG